MTSLSSIIRWTQGTRAGRKHDEIVRRLNEMIPIAEPANTFKMMITVEGVQSLALTMSPLRELVVGEVRSKNYDVAVRLMRLLVRLAQLLESSDVSGLLENIRGDIKPKLDIKVNETSDLLKKLHESYWFIEPSWFPWPEFLEIWTKKDVKLATDLLGDLIATADSELGTVVSPAHAVSERAISGLEKEEWEKQADVRELQRLYLLLQRLERGRRFYTLVSMGLVAGGARAYSQMSKL